MFLISAVFLSGCTELERSRTDDLFARATTPPRKQELRWSNGKLPKTLDPAKAAAAPETDLVRAVFEGLTELDSRTLAERPAAAFAWNATEDLKEWMFEIRDNAIWSNGDPLTADDFVRSWKRAAAQGRSAPFAGLFANIKGFAAASPMIPPVSNTSVKPLPHINVNTNTNSNSSSLSERERTSAPDEQPGLQAVGPKTLKVLLVEPDRDFPKLVSHPVFRPVHRLNPDIGQPDAAAITNGAFRIKSVGAEGVELERSDSYWNRDSVKLDRVRFVPVETAEKTLEAYRAGEIDAITNTSFSPVLLKLLAPYADFRRSTFAALNFYEFNTTLAPFDDRRVRQALSMAIERDRLSEGELEGVTSPATTFLPFGASAGVSIVQDRQRAADLLDEAGFPNGEQFPVIRLAVNRNDTQIRIARSIAAMWRDALSIDTEIIVRENSEMDDVRRQGDFDLIRRGVVLPTPDELANMKAILGGQNPAATPSESPSGRSPEPISPSDSNSNTVLIQPRSESNIVMLTSHEQALYELPAIPLYFSSSYSLVKPFVVGFESNMLDSPSLIETYIDESWQPEATKNES
ncbi:MAG: peptide ABC transporter substrate-binding protein [Pyrinomonadaceae bacterium]|nr:peptide ABC transporter substrate-binding protein [Pyrinomonadaceae bacterium]